MNKTMMILCAAALVVMAAMTGCKKEEPLVITADYLAGSKWGPENGRYGWYVEFRRDGTYSENFAGEGCGGYNGTYAIAGGLTVLNTNQKDPCTPDMKPVVNRKCTVEKSADSLYRQVKLVCDGTYIYFRQQGDAAAAEKEVVVKGVPAVTLGARNAVATEAVMFRESPDKAGKLIVCKNSDPESTSFSALPKGMQLIVLARTKEKASVGKWENFWYYVDPNIDWYSGCSSMTGWVFGEFVEFK